MIYEVWVNFSGCAKYEIEASSEEEAKDLAIEQAEPYDCDEWDYEAEID